MHAALTLASCAYAASLTLPARAPSIVLPASRWPRAAPPIAVLERAATPRPKETLPRPVVGGSEHRLDLPEPRLDPPEPRPAERPADEPWDPAPRLALLGMAAVCGLNFPLIHLTETATSAPEVTFLRFSCALLPFLPLLAERVGRLGADDPTAAKGLEIGAWCALGYITQAIGLAQTSPSRGAFICALFMVVTPLANGVLGRRVPPQAWLAVAVALLGTAFLEGVVPLPGLAQAADATAALNMGDVWCGGGALGFGAMFARMESHMEGMDPDDALPLTAWQLVSLFGLVAAWRAQTALGAAAGGLGLGGLGEWLGGLQATCEAEPLFLPSVLFMGFVSGAGVLWGETIALRKVPSTEAGVIFATEPLWAVGAAALLLHDAVTPQELAGGALIVFACLALQLPESALAPLVGGGRGADRGA